jgi:hypothetical protein
VNRLMESLIVPSLPGSTAIAPHLSRLLFMCTEDAYIDFMAYLQMVKSRWQSRWQAPDCALKAAALLLESDPRPDAATLRGLHTLSQEGLDFLFLAGRMALPGMKSEMYTADGILF